MAKKEDKYLTTFDRIRSLIKNGSIKNNVLIFTPERILFEEIIESYGKKFIGRDFRIKKDVKMYFSDDASIENLINECSNISFFSERKIVVYKIIKKPGVRGIAKNNKKAVLNYIDTFNSETILILWVQDNEFTFSNFEEFENQKTDIFILKNPDEETIIQWITEKFGDYKIDRETIFYFLQFVNYSFDEIFTEIEKLKTYCINKKEVTEEDINLCIGMSKDYDNDDFLVAVFTRNTERAIKIYERISLAAKDDPEILLLSMLNSSFIAISKLFDPAFNSIKEDNVYFTLKIWGNKRSQRLRSLREYKRTINLLKLYSAFEYIYETDKSFKTSQGDKGVIFTSLIIKITNL
jgi:DNA polymerase-3 subunit delta